MKNLIKALESAADGAFMIDSHQIILYWNQAAQEILGFTPSEVSAQLCYRILHGYDEQNQLFCREYCYVARRASLNKPTSNFNLRARTKQGGDRWINISVFTYTVSDDNEDSLIMHLFRDISHQKDSEQFFSHLIKAATKYQNLPSSKSINGNLPQRLLEITPRERDVLTRLAKGYSTSEIAQDLFISLNTVRNHIQRILKKLGVHSRLEAVIYAIKNGLID